MTLQQRKAQAAPSKGKSCSKENWKVPVKERQKLPAQERQSCSNKRQKLQQGEADLQQEKAELASICVTDYECNAISMTTAPGSRQDSAALISTTRTRTYQDRKKNCTRLAVR